MCYVQASWEHETASRAKEAASWANESASGANKVGFIFVKKTALNHKTFISITLKLERLKNLRFRSVEG